MHGNQQVTNPDLSTVWGGGDTAAHQDMRVVRGVVARLSIPSLVTGSSSVLGEGGKAFECEKTV